MIRAAVFFAVLASCATTPRAPRPIDCEEPVATSCAGPPADARFRVFAPFDPEQDPQNWAGEPTRELTQALRLFELGRLEEAIVLLRLVAGGQTGDFHPNEQWAQLHLGIALARSGQWNSALPLFLDLAKRPGVHGHDEAVQWLLRAANGECATVEAFEAIVELPDLEERLQTRPSAELHYALARGLFRRGERARAEYEFAFAATSPRHADVARACIRTLSASRLRSP